LYLLINQNFKFCLQNVNHVILPKWCNNVTNFSSSFWYDCDPRKGISHIYSQHQGMDLKKFLGGSTPKPISNPSLSILPNHALSLQLRLAIKITMSEEYYCIISMVVPTLPGHTHFLANAFPKPPKKMF